MTKQEAVEFGLTLDSMAEVFGAQLSTTRKLAYWTALEDLTLAEMKEACAKAIRSEAFFPVPATLRKIAGYVEAEQIPPAETAWLRLRNKHTRYNRDALSDPLTREVFEAMGGGYVLEWGFGNWPAEKEEQKRREFISWYKAAQNARAIESGQRKVIPLLPKGA